MPGEPTSSAEPGRLNAAPEEEAEQEADQAAWIGERRKFVHGRGETTRTSAQTWLGVMTTLLGLFSAVVVINHGTAITDLPSGAGWRWVVFLLAVAAYSVAFTAMFYGARATFGGLGLGRPGTLPDATAGKPGGQPAAREEPPQPASPGPPPGAEQPRQRTPISEAIKEIPEELKNWWSPEPLANRLETYTWQDYRNHQLKSADKLRTHLHRSRVLGIMAALLAAVLALAVLGLGAFAQPAPTSVMVVHGGHLTCGPITVGADGQTGIGGQVISRATQVIVVAHC